MRDMITRLGLDPEQMKSSVCKWPYSDAEHAEDLAVFLAKENTMIRTAQDYSADYNLFAEYIDPDATTSREEFEAMTENERLALIESVMAANS